MTRILHFTNIEAKVERDTDLLSKMDLYCVFFLDYQQAGVSSVAAQLGKHPIWTQDITLKVDNNVTLFGIRIMDQDIIKDDFVAECRFNLKDFEAEDFSKRQYNLKYDNMNVGWIRMNAFFETSTESTETSVVIRNDGSILSFSNDPERDKEIKAIESVNQEEFDKEFKELRESQKFLKKRTYIERREKVEDYKFLKELDSTDIKTSKVQVEVMTTKKVLRDVEYTEPVVVTKKVQALEPVVTKRKIKVIEPQLVRKIIEVIENVEVEREVEIVEMRSVEKEVQTVELVTKTKQVEVTERTPQTVEFTVREPITVTKCVEFVEPVITTQTIIKEVHEAVAVDHIVKHEVGPISVLGIHTGNCPIDIKQFEKQSGKREKKPALDQRSGNVGAENVPTALGTKAGRLGESQKTHLTAK